MNYTPLNTTVATLLLAGLLTVATSAPPAYADTDSDHCSYHDAVINDGWGYNPSTGESCPPLPSNVDQAAVNCSYQDAAQNDGWGYDHTTELSCPPFAVEEPESAAGTQLVLQLRGTGIAEERTFDTTGDGVPDTTAPCFDAAVFDPATGLQIGTGSDCLDVQSNDNGNIQLTGYGFFTLDGGTLVVKGNTTVRPVLQTTIRDGIEFTHITGANGDDGVLYGDGRYLGATGGVRLSGQVDMSRLMSDNEIYFDCLFVVELNP